MRQAFFLQVQPLNYTTAKQTQYYNHVSCLLHVTESFLRDTNNPFDSWEIP